MSSGVYERCFVYEDVLYHHILNPKTGYPVDNNLYQVTILCKDSKTADALSTSLLLLGNEKGSELLKSYPEAHAVFIDSENTLSYSEDFPE